MKKFADIYAEYNGFKDANSMMKHLNDSGSTSSMGEIIGQIVKGEIINAFTALDRSNESKDEEEK